MRGVAGDGWIELNAFDTPRFSVFAQGTLYNNSVEGIRIGHLTGMPSISTGIAAARPILPTRDGSALRPSTRADLIDHAEAELRPRDPPLPPPDTLH